MVIAHLFASCVCVRRAARLVPAPAALLLAGLVSTAGSALAQPGGVTVTDLGTFAGSASTLQSPNLTLTTAAPVAWYKIRLPRIADPHRYLDISTSGAGFSDSEIALYSSTGTLIAADDDDGANNYSALSFGITNPSAAGRVPPIAQAGQTAGAPFDGRDGTLSGNANVGLLGTAGDYYIAVTRFDATFGNNFGVIPPAGPASDFSMLLTVRMNTPGGQVAPTVDGDDAVKLVGDSNLILVAGASSNASSVSVDLSPIGASATAQMNPVFADVWHLSTVVAPLTTTGTFPLLFRASNAIGDVTVDQATLTVRPLAAVCVNATQRQIASTPGTTVYTYDTAFGNVDGPWTSACFNPVQPPTGNDVWFRMFPSTNGTLTLSTCNSDTGFVGTQPDTLLGFRGRCDDGGFSVCGDDVGGCGLGTRLTNIPVTAGLEYNFAVRAWGSEIAGGRIAVTFIPGCDDIDFNNNEVFPEDQDVVDFFNVLAGGDCPACNDIDFNNNGVFPEDQDIVDFFNVLAGGAC